MSGISDVISYGPTFVITDEEKLAIDFEHIFRIRLERVQGELSHEQKKRATKAFVVYESAERQSRIYVAPQRRMPMDGILVRGSYNDIRTAVLQQ